MLNTYNVKNNPRVEINAVSGAIVKSHKKSWMKRFHLESDFAARALCENSNAVVLQMVVCGNMQVMAELISKTDFEEAGRIDNEQ